MALSDRTQDPGPTRLAIITRYLANAGTSRPVDNPPKINLLQSTQIKIMHVANRETTRHERRLDTMRRENA